MNITELLNKLVQKKDITTEEARMFVEEVIDGKVPASQVAAVLTALRMKGESVDEILGLIQIMREKMVKVAVPEAIDIVGTGGDGHNTFNISTAASFVVAGCGVKVAKHGNRAASSKCGSADVLEELGVKIDISSEQAKSVLTKVGMVFLFAPLYHPAFKTVAMIRKELGIRTIFNFLGPFANPAGVTRQMIGVPSYEIAKKMAAVAKRLSYEQLFLITSEDGMDEVSLSVKTHVFEISGKRVKEFLLDPKTFGFGRVSSETIKGGTAKENAQIVKEILNGELQGPKSDIVIINSACALVAAGVAKNIKDGIALAKQSIANGSAEKVLKELIKETQKYAK